MAIDKRVIVLVDEQILSWLKERSFRSRTSVGELVRRAIKYRMTEKGCARLAFDCEDLGEEAAEKIKKS